jgi:hypothetical protein
MHVPLEVLRRRPTPLRRTGLHLRGQTIAKNIQRGFANSRPLKLLVSLYIASIGLSVRDQHPMLECARLALTVA